MNPVCLDVFNGYYRHNLTSQKMLQTCARLVIYNPYTNIYVAKQESFKKRFKIYFDDIFMIKKLILIFTNLFHSRYIYICLIYISIWKPVENLIKKVKQRVILLYVVLVPLPFIAILNLFGTKYYEQILFISFTKSTRYWNIKA